MFVFHPQLADSEAPPPEHLSWKWALPFYGQTIGPVHVHHKGGRNRHKKKREGIQIRSLPEAIGVHIKVVLGIEITDHGDAGVIAAIFEVAVPAKGGRQPLGVVADNWVKAAVLPAQTVATKRHLFVC